MDLELLFDHRFALLRQDRAHGENKPNRKKYCSENQGDAGI